MSTRLGPVVGAIIGVYLADRLAATQQYSDLIWGLVIIVVVVVAPGGIVTTVARVLTWARQRVLASAVPRVAFSRETTGGMDGNDGN